MTSHPPSNVDSVTPPPESETFTPSSFGSSVYGGRPTFAIVRHDDADGASLTLYELLPHAQAEARQARLRRENPNRGLVTEPFGAVFGESAAPEVDRWDWEEWTAVKITRLSESRLRSILPLVRETLNGGRVRRIGRDCDWSRRGVPARNCRCAAYVGLSRCETDPACRPDASVVSWYRANE